jgi:hypothetical protein
MSELSKAILERIVRPELAALAMPSYGLVVNRYPAIGRLDVQVKLPNGENDQILQRLPYGKSPSQGNNLPKVGDEVGLIFMGRNPHNAVVIPLFGRTAMPELEPMNNAGGDIPDVG